MTRTKMTCIARICPACDAPNTVIALTTEFRPAWKMTCSRCGHAIGQGDEPEPPLDSGRTALAQAAPVPLPPLPAAIEQTGGREGWPRRRRGVRRLCALSIGLACAAVATALLLGAGRDDRAGAPDGYEVMLTAAIGPDAMLPPEGAPRAEPLLVPSLAAPEGAAGDGRRLAKARLGDGSGRRARQAALGEALAGPGESRLPARSESSGGGDQVGMEKAPPVVAARPLPDPETAAAAEAALDLTRRERREVQRRLGLASHDPKLVDGIFGPATRAAIRSWQGAAGLPATGFMDGDALALLGRQTEDEYRAWRAAERARARKRQRTETAQLHSPLPPVSPAGIKCRRDGTGGIAYGQNVRCDFRGLREELRGVREHVVELLRGPERS